MIIWLIFGFLLGVGTVYLKNREDIKMAWFDWLIMAVALVFFILAIVNYNGSMAELEPRAAWFLLVSFGVPGLILAAVVGIRAWRNRQPEAVQATS